jgi:hypothetical protein
VRPLPARAIPLLLLLAAGALQASEVRIFRTDSQRDFLAGTFDGISVDPLGTLRLADRAERLTAIEEPFLLSAAAAPDGGWILGTGNAGRVLEVDEKGVVSTLFEAAEPEIFAVLAAPDGTVYAGSSPGGKVYRYRDGTVEAWFDPQQTYIWALAGLSDGTLLVATGTEGKLFAVSPAGAGRLLYDSDDTHVRALQVRGEDRVLAGTAGEGLVLEIDTGGRVRTLYDATQPEIVAFAGGDAGEVYFAALASEASLIDLSRSSSASGGEEKDDDEDEEKDSDEPRPRITVEAGASSPAGSRSASFSGPRSEILRLGSGGAVGSIWKFSGETVYTLLWRRDRLWVGTGLEGKLYSYRDQKMVLEKDFDERQIVALLEDRLGPAFATTNAAALYRLTGGTEREGVYSSPILDAGSIARFGTLHWNGEIAAGTSVRFAVRSGVSSEPDRTWSPWSEAEEGREVSLSEVPRGRYVQWRATLVASDGRSPQVHGVELSYLQDNQRPEIESLAVLDPGQVLVPSNFNPSSQVFEPAHPNREGIFTTLEPSADSSESTRLKKLWKLGHRTLQWEASDPNGDDLVYRLSFRREDDNEEGWLPLEDDLEEDHLSFDATVLPDGRYRFRIEADDRPDNTPEDALVAERISSTVVIDHGDPELEEVSRSSGQLRVTVKDALSPLREATYSVDAGPWKNARSVDGLLDGRREVVILDVPEDATLVLLRVTDASHNAVTVDVSPGGRADVSPR